MKERKLIMKKIYRLEDLDCANCAAKMERGIQKIKGVHHVTVSFLTQKMMIEAEDESFNHIMEQVIVICKKVEPDCRIML